MSASALRRVLLASVAITAAMPAAGPAAQVQAQPPTASQEKPIQLRLGGFFRLYGTAGAQDDNNANRAGGSTLRQHGIGRESEVWFRGETQLDNGLRVGVQVELEGETSPDQIDLSYIYFQHANFGRLILGEDYGASFKTHKGVVGMLTGIGALGHFRSHVYYADGLNQVAGGLNTFLFLDGASDKIIYDTPRLMGLRVNLGYTPDDKTRVTSTAGPGESGLGLNPDRDGPASTSEVWAATLDYLHEWQGIVFAASTGFQMGNSEKSNSLFAGRQFQGDPIGYNFGLEAAFGGFRVGGAFKRVENNPIAVTAATAAIRGIQTSTNGPQTFYQGDREDWLVGLEYTTGRWRFGATYGHAEQELPMISGKPNGGTTRYTDKLDQATLGVNYALGPGITLFGGALYFDLQGDRGPRASGFDTRHAADNDGFVFVLGTQLSF